MSKRVNHYSTLVYFINKSYSTINIILFASIGSLFIVYGNSVKAASGTTSSNSNIGMSVSSSKSKNASSSILAKKKITKRVNYFKDTTDSESSQENPNDYLIVPVKHISQGVTFEENLTVNEYQILVEDLLVKEYPNMDPYSVTSLYFFRALAENVYSLNGYMPPNIFNSIVDDRETFREINIFITNLDIKPAIKTALKRLYVILCIYLHDVRSDKYPVKDLSKIPSNAILYELENQPVSMLGDFVGGEYGENLYYICGSFYKGFTELPKNIQLKVIEYIYSFNPTLTIAEPIAKKYYFYNYVKDFIIPPKRYELLKYQVRGEATWIILPQNIDMSLLEKSNDKVKKANKSTDKNKNENKNN